MHLKQSWLRPACNDSAPEIPMLKSYWAQWDTVTFNKGVLKRVLEDDDGKTGDLDKQKGWSVITASWWQGILKWKTIWKSRERVLLGQPTKRSPRGGVIGNACNRPQQPPSAMLKVPSTRLQSTSLKYFRKPQRSLRGFQNTFMWQCITSPNGYLQDIYKILDFKKTRTTPLHTQSDRMVEHVLTELSINTWPKLSLTINRTRICDSTNSL